LVSGSRDGTIIVWDLMTAPHLGQILVGHTDWVESLAFSPDGRTLASGSCKQRYAIYKNDKNCDQSEIYLWDLVTRQPLGNPLVDESGWVRSLAFSPDGKILASGTDSNVIAMWNVVTRSRLDLGGPVLPTRSVTFSPDGKVLASGSGTIIVLWDVAAGKPLGQLLSEYDSASGYVSAVESVVFSPNGKMLASGNSDGTIILLDVATRQIIGQPLKGHTDAVHSVAFSPDGKTLASASEDNTIILWDVLTRQPLGPPLMGHSGGVLGVVFSPDSRMLASGDWDGTVILWDSTTRQPLGQPFRVHTNSVTGVAFSRDSKTLASSSRDKTIILWDVSVESWKARACEIVGRNLTRAEWESFLPGQPYRKTCPQWTEGK